MSVRAVLHSVGSRLDSASLNIPGQSFAGTVTFNRIDGVFDIAHPRYDGSGASPFPPPDWSEHTDLQRYLAPEPFIESDDPEIAAMAAMCRSVGIPARMVTGAMYFVMDHGKFGQHGWNEIYMGDAAGGITLDTTIGEVDYVDSGHIRLGEACTFEPVTMEIVEYELKADSSTTQ